MDQEQICLILDWVDLSAMRPALVQIILQPLPPRMDVLLVRSITALEEQGAAGETKYHPPIHSLIISL